MFRSCRPLHLGFIMDAVWFSIHLCLAPRGTGTRVLLKLSHGPWASGRKESAVVRAQASHQCGPGSISAWPRMWAELVCGSRVAPAENLPSGASVSLPTETLKLCFHFTHMLKRNYHGVVHARTWSVFFQASENSRNATLSRVADRFSMQQELFISDPITGENVNTDRKLIKGRSFQSRESISL